MGGKVDLLRRHGSEEDSGRRQDRRDPGALLSHGLPAVRGNRRRRRQYLGGDSGPQRAEDHVGRRSARDLRLQSLSRGDGGDGARSRARSCAPKATSPPLSPARTRKSRPNITSRTSRMRRWSRPSATCRIVDGKAEVWTSVQSPQAAHDLVAKYLGLPPENVTVNVTLLGGGFGRKIEAGLRGRGGAGVERRSAARR